MNLHITEKALNQVTVPAGKKYILVFDSQQTGFAVQKTKKGTMSYVIVYRNQANQQRQEKLATVGTVSAQAARGLAKARLDMLAEQKAGTPRVQRGALSPTMDE